jgi:Tfp pilus assembly protein PilF
MASRNAERALHYHRNGQYKLAIDAYTAALLDEPDNSFYLGNRAEMFVLMGRFDDAIRDFQIALRDLPNEEAFWVNYGLALQSRGHFDAALAAFVFTLRKFPKNPFALFNLGVLLERDMGEHGSGVEYFRRALEIEPGFDHAVGGLSFYHLKTGNFVDGWRDFEYRNLKGPPTKLPGLLWNGQQTEDTLVLVCEQGIGDVIQFSRYAAVAAYNGQPTAIYAPEEFKSLLSSLGHGVKIFTRPEEVVEPYQWLPIMSMPRMMGTTVETIPAPRSYLSSTPKRIEKWRSEIWRHQDWGIRANGKRFNFNIGICWAPGHQWLPHAFSRIIPLEMFRDIANIPGVHLFSLQKDGPATQAAEMDFKIIDLGGDPIPRQDLFEDAAAIMQNLDLVISTDTAALHVAGAVGARTFAALPKGTCWRWLLDRDDSPWYPTMRLFRQQKVGDWTEVFGRITAAVRDLVE